MAKIRHFVNILKCQFQIGGLFMLGNIYVTFLSQGRVKYLILLTFRRAHNPKVGGSNPSPATNKRPSVIEEIPGGFRFSGRLF